MAINYQKTRDRTTRLLTQNGQTYQLFRGGGVQMVGGKEVATLAESGTPVGVITSYAPSEIDGKLILTGDIKLTATWETEIRIDDRIEVDGKKYRVVQPGPVKPAAVLLCYKVQLRA